MAESTYFFNAKVMSEHFAGDEDVMIAVAEAYLENYENSIHRLQQAICNKNVKETEIAAHTMKGTIANFFVREIYENLRRIEQSGKIGLFKEAGMEFQKTIPILNKFNIELKEFVGRCRVNKKAV